MKAIMDALWKKARTLNFCPVVSSSSTFFYLFPRLISRRRLDVYHTSIYGEALVRISDAGLKCAAHGSLKYRTQKVAKKSPSGHHRTTLSGYIFATKASIDNREKLVKQQYLHTFPQYGELRPTSG